METTAIPIAVSTFSLFLSILCIIKIERIEAEKTQFWKELRDLLKSEFEPLEKRLDRIEDYLHAEKKNL